MSLTRKMRVETLAFVEENGRATRDAIIDHLYDVFGPEIAAESDRRKREWVWSVANDALKQAVVNSGAAQPQQSVLPGFPPPAVISVDNESPNTHDAVYIAFEWATWADLEGHRALKIANIIHAQEALNDWEDKMDALRPYMVGHPDRTVREAVALMKGGNA